VFLLNSFSATTLGQDPPRTLQAPNYRAHSATE
jgi:hypothetical protein